MVTAIAALVGAPVAGLAAVYGNRGANRAAREGGIIGGYNNLTDQLQEERKELREELRTARAENAAKDIEIERLKLVLAQHGITV
jgi:hypothetical protein